MTGAKAVGDEISSTPTPTMERVAPVTVEGDYATTFVSYGMPGLGYEPRTPVSSISSATARSPRSLSFVTGAKEPFDNVAR